MNKYELAVKVSQVQSLVEERKYRKAAAVLGTIDVHQVRNSSDLQIFAEVYVKTEQFEAAKAIYLRLYKRNHSKKILYRLIYLSIRTNHLDEAEDFYEEFLTLNHSEQEALILRYRLDKAQGATFNRLIETLEKLKEEEYVEEWAYELAKLYQRAGRDDDCRRECEDIKLWFGSGEIVDRAEMLIEFLDGEQELYYEDRDYTIEEPEEPNPDDTGSLPDLDAEMMKKEIEKLKRKRKEEKKRFAEPEAFVDDYEEDEEVDSGEEEPEQEAAPKKQKAKSGFQRFRDFWKRGEKEHEHPGQEKRKMSSIDVIQAMTAAVESSTEYETGQEAEGEVLEAVEEAAKDDEGLAQEMEDELSAWAVAAMAKDSSSDADESAEEQEEEPGNAGTMGVNEESDDASQGREDGPAEGLDASIAKGRMTGSKVMEEDAHGEIQPEAVAALEHTVLAEPQNKTTPEKASYEEEDVSVPKDATKKIRQGNFEEEDVEQWKRPASQEEPKKKRSRHKRKGKEGKNKEKLLEAEKAAKQSGSVEKDEMTAAVESALAEQAAAQQGAEGLDRPSQSGLGITKDLAKEITAIFEAEKRGQLKEKAVAVVDDAAGKINDVPNLASDVLGRMTQAMQNKVGKKYIPMDVSVNEEPEPGEESFIEENESVEEQGMEKLQSKEQEDSPTQVTRPVGMEEIVQSGILPMSEEEVTMIELDQIMPEPDIPELKQVMPEDSPELGNLPELEDEELPTTRALHHSFDDILTLIAGELEPKHFVLMGEGGDRILGITKKIVRVNHQKGFLSTNQIARIRSEQLNEMDLLKVCHQIKGSCLLVDEAAGLSFPTITKIFAVMDAFHGDFVVVLADEGSTLDELFRVAPALARRFEYVIDISQYDEEDYQ